MKKLMFLTIILIMNFAYSELIIGSNNILAISGSSTLNLNCHNAFINGTLQTNNNTTGTASFINTGLFTTSQTGTFDIEGLTNVTLSAWINDGTVIPINPTQGTLATPLNLSFISTCNIPNTIAGISDTDGDGIADNDEGFLVGGIWAFLDPSIRGIIEEIINIPTNFSWMLMGLFFSIYVISRRYNQTKEG